MIHPHVLSSVVVGIDGSDAAIAAALWAADEAIARDLPLRLIHAADVAAAHPRGDFRLQITEAEPLSCRRAGRGRNRQDGQSRNSRCRGGTAARPDQRITLSGNAVRGIGRGGARRPRAGVDGRRASQRSVLSGSHHPSRCDNTGSWWRVDGCQH